MSLGSTKHREKLRLKEFSMALENAVTAASLYCVLAFFLLLRFCNSRYYPAASETQGKDDCENKRVYVYDVPRKFNLELLDKCDAGIVKWLKFCDHASNKGFGQPLSGDAQKLLGTGWYRTDSYMLEVIFHSRIRSYRCVTNDSSRADAFYVPYYAGLDALHYLYNANANKSLHGAEMAEWLQRNSAERRRDGSDHFMVMGRTAWDFGNSGSWGTRILNDPTFSSMKLLFLERNPWSRSQVAVPYPTSFHPSSRQELQQWIGKVRGAERSFLFAFAGALRPSQETSIRSLLLDQCLGKTSISRSPSTNSSTNSSSISIQRCDFVDCGELGCAHNPAPIIESFLRSDFCLQPRGDTATRRSAFDAMLAGCIPVFFHKDSSYRQYTWHLLGDPRGYSVFVPETEITGGKVALGEVLGTLARQKVVAMRERLIEMIPMIVYTTGLAGVEDAFDVAIEGVLQSIGHPF